MQNAAGAIIQGDPRVRLGVRDGVAVVTVDNPPVNALSSGVSEAILLRVRSAGADPAVQAIVLLGAGRGFIAGADISELGEGRRRLPVGQRLYDLLDKTAKPLVAAIHGHALGGGLEVALACNYRIAMRSARIGLPEVNIGLIPGAGGTQRLPRLIGTEPALDLISAGRHVKAPEAARLGILDALLDDDGDLETQAVAFARSVADKRPLPCARNLHAEASPGLFERKRAELARKMRGRQAPLRACDAVEAAVTLPFEEGMSAESRIFSELENSDEARALRYAFFAERKAAKLPAGSKGDMPIAQTAIIGAGTMGAGIAMAFADNGLAVSIMDAKPDALERGMQRIRASYSGAVARGSISSSEADGRLSLIRPIGGYGDMSSADVVIEAAFEDLAVKRSIFAELDGLMKPGALLLSNTSSIDIDAIAAATARPGDVAGAHFFSPANVMKLLEVVAGRDTSPEAIAATMLLGKRLGKVCVRAGNTDGFVANRSRGAMVAEAMVLLEEGALPEQVDRVMTEFGFPMGPFAVSDLAGLDISWAVRKRKASEDPGFRPQRIADRLCEMGRFGRKTGAGWYSYAGESAKPEPDPVVAEVIREVVSSLGLSPRDFSDEAILHRLMFAAVNECCRILDDRKAACASDIDVMWLYGFGFPRYRGGPMYWADTIGAREIYRRVELWHRDLGARWTPSATLKRVAEADGKLSAEEATLA